MFETNTSLKYLMLGVVVACVVLGAFVGAVSGEMWHADLYTGDPPSTITYADEGGQYTNHALWSAGDRMGSAPYRIATDVDDESLIEEDLYTSEETIPAETPVVTETLPVPTDAPTVTPIPEKTPTWYVGDDRADYPGANFTRIQDAVDAASASDTITIRDEILKANRSFAIDLISETIIVKKSSMMPPIVYSNYTSTPPVIDGLLSENEWGSPAITIHNVLTNYA